MLLFQNGLKLENDWPYRDTDRKVRLKGATGTYEVPLTFIGHMVILGSFGEFVSKWPLTQK